LGFGELFLIFIQMINCSQRLRSEKLPKTGENSPTILSITYLALKEPE